MMQFLKMNNFFSSSFPEANSLQETRVEINCLHLVQKNTKGLMELSYSDLVKPTGDLQELNSFFVFCCQNQKETLCLVTQREFSTEKADCKKALF